MTSGLDCVKLSLRKRQYFCALSRLTFAKINKKNNIGGFLFSYSRVIEQKETFTTMIKGGLKMKRKKMPRTIDQKVFKATAKKTKAVNVSPIVKRGGIRL